MACCDSCSKGGPCGSDTHTPQTLGAIPSCTVPGPQINCGDGPGFYYGPGGGILQLLPNGGGQQAMTAPSSAALLSGAYSYENGHLGYPNKKGGVGLGRVDVPATRLCEYLPAGFTRGACEFVLRGRNLADVCQNMPAQVADALAAAGVNASDACAELLGRALPGEDRNTSIQMAIVDRTEGLLRNPGGRFQYILKRLNRPPYSPIPRRSFQFVTPPETQRQGLQLAEITYFLEGESGYGSTGLPPNRSWSADVRLWSTAADPEWVEGEATVWITPGAPPVIWNLGIAAAPEVVNEIPRVGSLPANGKAGRGAAKQTNGGGGGGAGLLLAAVAAAALAAG